MTQIGIKEYYIQYLLNNPLVYFQKKSAKKSRNAERVRKGPVCRCLLCKHMEIRQIIHDQWEAPEDLTTMTLASHREAMRLGSYPMKGRRRLVVCAVHYMEALSFWRMLIDNLASNKISGRFCQSDQKKVSFNEPPLNVRVILTSITFRYPSTFIEKISGPTCAKPT